MSRGSRTDGSRLDHVADGEALDGLVLGGAASAVGAAHGLDVAAAILVTTAGEIQLVPMLPCEYAFHDIQSPFRVDSVVNAHESCFANVAIFFFFIYIEGCGVASNSSASLRRFISDGRLDSRKEERSSLTCSPAS